MPIGESPDVRRSGYGSLHSSVTSQPKTIGHFTAYPKQIEFDFGHFTAYYLLVGVCCPRGLIYVVNLISFIDLDLITIVICSLKLILKFN